MESYKEQLENEKDHYNDMTFVMLMKLIARIDRDIQSLRIKIGTQKKRIDFLQNEIKEIKENN